MNAGKLPGVVEKRSVLNYTGNHGFEAAKVSCNGDFVLVSDSALIEYVCQVDMLLDRVLGLLASEGVSKASIAATVLIPENWEENNTQKAEEKYQKNDMTCQKVPENIKNFLRILMDAFSKREFSAKAAVNIKVGAGRHPAWLSLSAGGVRTEPYKIPSNISERVDGFVPEQYFLVMGGYAALEATRILLASRWEPLSLRLSKQYLKEGWRASEMTDVRQAVQAAIEAAAFVKLPGEGGIFAALWEIGEFLNCGMEIDLKKILLRQETIEVCEWLDINPYLTFSGGCVLAVTDKPEALAAACRQKRIPTAILGRLTSGSDRVIQNSGEQRFLEPFRQDELYRAHILDTQK